MKTTACDYMMELVNYGGTIVPRGYAYQLLLDFAKAQGNDKARCRLLADRWMQGYDLKQEHAQHRSLIPPATALRFEVERKGER